MSEPFFATISNVPFCPVGVKASGYSYSRFFSTSICFPSVSAKDNLKEKSEPGYNINLPFASYFPFAISTVVTKSFSLVDGFAVSSTLFSFVTFTNTNGENPFVLITAPETVPSLF